MVKRKYFVRISSVLPYIGNSVHSTCSKRCIFVNDKLTKHSMICGGTRQQIPPLDTNY